MDRFTKTPLMTAGYFGFTEPAASTMPAATWAYQFGTTGACLTAPTSNPARSFATFIISGVHHENDASDHGAWSPLRVVCHEDRRSKRRCATVREMKEGPSRPAVRFWPQTAASCCRQKRWW